MTTMTRWGVLLAAALGCAACAQDAVVDDALAHPAPTNDFEKAFAAEPGVQPIQWGGWMKTEVAGTGASPTPDDKVRVNYRGTLVDGTEFDSSYKRGQPATFPLGNVIPCWTNGMLMMKTGGKAKFVCPAAAAYGDRGSPPLVPGGATLVFEIELLAVVR